MAVMLLEWIATSVFLILVVLALRAALGKRMSAGARYALWAVVLVRLLVPVQLFTSPIAGTWVVTEKRTEYDVADWPSVSAAVPDVPAGNALGLPVNNAAGGSAPTLPEPPVPPDAPEPPDLGNPPGWLANLGWIWLAGSAAVALVFLASNLRFYRRLRGERIPMEHSECPVRAYVVAGLPSPCLFGILKPAVYVTPEASADPDMLRHVLAHEYTHLRHGDHLWSLLRCAALAVHWWNPLVWASAALSRRDGELACDEGALKRLGDSERLGYGNTLLTLVTAKPRPEDLFRCATTMAGDKKSLKERINRIAVSPKRVVWAVVAAVLVTALASVCAFGQAAEPEDEAGSLSSPGPAPSAGQSAAPAYDGTVPEQVRADAEEFVQGNFEALRDRGVSFGLDGAVVVDDLPELDEWRIDSLTGPYWSGEQYWELLHIQRRVEVWNVVYSFHTTPETRDKAWNLANGATELTEDGWLTPINYGAEYLVYELGEDGSRTLLTTTFGEVGEFVGSVNFRRNLRIELSGGGVPEDMADAYFVEEHAGFPLSDLGHGVDLNRNGVPELVQVVEIEDYGSRQVEVWEENQLLWADEANTAHVGWNAVFLCTLDGEDYLLRYHPTMYQGHATYEYELFTLENGRETVVKTGYVEFDINFHPLFQYYDFDPEAIAAFMDEVNGLLADSVQLVNTDGDLVRAFEREGRLYDSLSWLDGWEPAFARDGDKSLLENLRDFKAAMEAEWYAEEPVLSLVSDIKGNEARVWLRYQDRSTQFDALWEWGFQPEEAVNAQVLDLNGDGKNEVVFSLVEGHGTGCLVENLYVFDAETLEQYDTSAVTELILGSIRSTGDMDNFYLSGFGLDLTIPKSEARAKNPDAPMADKLGFGDIIRYTVKDGQVSCWLGIDAGMGINYIGYIQVPVRLSPSGGLSCDQAQYVEGEPSDPLF